MPAKITQKIIILVSAPWWHFHVEFNGIRSESYQVKCGVPQGSILGPLLFVLHINDLCDVSKAVDFILFVDDTKLTYFFPIKI